MAQATTVCTQNPTVLSFVKTTFGQSICFFKLVGPALDKRGAGHGDADYCDLDRVAELLQEVAKPIERREHATNLGAR